jgi:hypothetical protein
VLVSERCANLRWPQERNDRRMGRAAPRLDRPAAHAAAAQDDPQPAELGHGCVCRRVSRWKAHCVVRYGEAFVQLTGVNGLKVHRTTTSGCGTSPRRASHQAAACSSRSSPATMAVLFHKCVRGLPPGSLLRSLTPDSVVDPAARFLVSASSDRGWGWGESSRTIFVHDIKHVT